MLRDDEHWLHYVFHKNDGYQTPLSLHPFRDKGNIDINRERELSKQRVLMTFIQASLKNDSESTMDFNGKSAVELKLTDRNSSKLQQISLRKYFKEHKGESLLQEDIENIKRIASVFGYFSDSDSQIFISAVTTLENIYNRYFYSIADRKIYRLALGWIEQNGLLERNSDISELIENIDRIKHNVVDSEFDVRIERLQQKFREFSKLSLLQIQRVKLIRDICVFWEKVGLHLPNHEVIRFGLPQSKIFVPFDSLTIKERCKHYLLYKTLAVFETYSSYTIDMQKEYYMFFAKSERLMYLNNAFGKLAEDWRLKSHITLKLRQTYNYIKPGGWNTSLIYGHEHKSNLVLGKLSEDIRSAMTHLDNMPPAIFYWDILFSEDGKSELVPLESFSSGEKQKLFCLAAIVYHLQNISSIGSESYRYNAVNLILEEVELYFHPEWQRSFINDLLNLIYQANIPKIKSVNLTFVTHSPYILSDIPKTNVLFMKNGLPDYSMQENTFGANINSLLKNGFFLPAIPMGEFANKKIQHLFAILHSGDFDSEELPRIYSEIMTVGEPLIRQQLLMLYNPYRALSMDDISAKAILNFLKNTQL
ncbi:MAG: ATP-binding protein [Muribaculaceae bacterium]|nr:ATP-binding protein [Muribaculaceae bacterium]